MGTSINTVVLVDLWDSWMCLLFSLLYHQGVNTLVADVDTKKQPREPHIVIPQTGCFVFTALAEKAMQLSI